MANVRVAVRVRPLSKREIKEGGRIIMEVDGKVAKIRNLKVDSRPDSFGDSREKIVAFGFDYCYWSVNPEDPQYASQDVVFQDLGTEVLSGAAKGYNICLFAYGQTGSGKTYTMLGTPASVGLTPRICEGLFLREEDCAPLPSCRITVSFLEIYNERVRDLLKQSDKKKSYILRVREHPEMGPYVQGLSQHAVTNYQQVIQLLEEGIANRITAATHVHEASSRSHAVFTIHYTQALLENNLPLEIASKINLVDLAGSERADPSYCKDRITEGANINKSLMTLGIVISTLAQNSQNVHSAASSGGDGGVPDSTSGSSSGGGPSRRRSYIPYRDSVLTWLLKDSLGGNSKTIMVATVSPAHTSYSETVSTLRYASNAKNIINTPRVNEDANVKLIRELREEIERLKAMLLSFELRNFSLLNDKKEESLKEIVLQNELKIDELTKDWTRKWNAWQTLLDHYSVDINKRRAGVVIDSSLPHLMALEDDVLSTGVVLYHLKEGTTKIGRIDSDQEQDIVLQGQWIERDHCTITSTCGVVILRPTHGARCTVNGHEVTASCRLTQGAVITLGKAQKFRFNHPAEAALLRLRRQVQEAVGNSGSLEWLDLDGDVTASQLGICPVLQKERRVLGEQCIKDHQLPRDGETSHRAQTHQQRCNVEDLKQILEGQISAQKELEFDQADSSQQIKDNQQWLLREETWLASLPPQQQSEDGRFEKDLEASVAPDVPEPPASPLVQSRKRVALRQFLGRHTRRKKISFQLERIIKKLRLLEAQRRLEQLRALCRPQDDGASTPSSNATVPGWTRCSSLSLQRLCSQYFPQLRSVFLNGDPSTVLPPPPDPTHRKSKKNPTTDPVPQFPASPPRTECLDRKGLCSSGLGQLYPSRGALDRKGVSIPGTCLIGSHNSVNSQEIEAVGKQPCQMASEDLETLQSANKLKPTNQTRRAKGLVASGNTQAWWKKGRTLSAHKSVKGVRCQSTHPHGAKQAAGHGKAARSFQAGSKPPPLSTVSRRHQRLLAARVRDSAKFSRLPHSTPLKRQLHAGDPDTASPRAGFGPVGDYAREKGDDFSDTGSSYSVDSLSPVSAKVPMELLVLEDLQGEPENSESDNSQISEDSLARRESQSPRESPRDGLPVHDHGHLKTRALASVRGFPPLSDWGLRTQAHWSFSSDSLFDAKEELGGEQGEPLRSSADEMPAEAFWHLQSASVPAVGQEATWNPRRGARLSTVLPTGSSFFLAPQFLPFREQPESEVEASCSEETSSPQCMQSTRDSPLVSMDSWFSCDSKINPGSPAGVMGSFRPSPDMKEVQPCGEEGPGHWINIEEVKPAGMEEVPSYSSKLPQGSAEPSCSGGTRSTTSTSETPKPSAWRTPRFLQPGAGDIFQGRGVPDTTQQGMSVDSQESSTSSLLATLAASFTHVGSVHDRDWAALQQKYLLELSRSAVEAEEEADSSSLANVSDKIDTRLPGAPGVSGNLDSSYFPVHLSTGKCLRAKREQDRGSGRLGSAAGFLSTCEKVSCGGTYPAHLESLASAACVAGNRADAREVKQDGSQERFQGSRKHGLMTSSDDSSFQNACHNNVTISSKEDPWPQDQAPLRKSTAVQPGQLSHSGHDPIQEEKTGSRKDAYRHAGDSSAVPLPSGPELYLHSAPWDPSLHPPPLETFYVTKSRDALTETALEIPACREVRVPSPPLREAWGFGLNHQVLKKAHVKGHLPATSQSQNSKITLSQLVAAKRPADLNTRDVIQEAEKCPANIKEENHDSAYCFVAQNRHQPPSASIKACEFKNQVIILTKKPGLPASMEGEEATAHCRVSLDRSGCGETFLFLCECEAGGEGEQGQTQACSVHRQFSGARSDFICKTTHVGLQKNIPEPTAVSLKSRSICCQVSSPVIVTMSESSSHKWERRNESRLLGKALLKDSTEERKHPGAASAYEPFQSATCAQERKPSECKGCGGSQEAINSKEPLGEKPHKRVNSADEMARLIRSVMQLESGILEIESKQNKQPQASHLPGVSKEFVFQDLKDQERVDHVLLMGGSGSHLFLKAQPSSPREMDDAVFGGHEAGGMVGDSAADNDPQTQKRSPSPFRSSDRARESRSTREHTHTAGAGRPAGDSCGLSGRGSADTSLPPRRRKTSVRSPPLHPRLDRSSQDGELLKTFADPKEQPWDLGHLEEFETVKSQESQIAEHVCTSKSADAQARGRVEEMAMPRGGSLEEKNNIPSLTKKSPSPSQHYKGAFFSQETVSLLVNQTDFSRATSHQGPRSALPLHLPRPPRSCLHASDTEGISSVSAHMLDSTALKLHSRVGHEDQGGETRSRKPQRCVRGGSPMALTAEDESVIPMTLGPEDQFVTPESIPLGTEDWIAANTSLQDQRGDLQIPSVGLSTQGSFVQEEMRVSRQSDKRVCFLLEEEDDQGGGTGHKTGETEDQRSASSACSAPVSLLRAPDPEPRLPDSSVHAAICLAILKEIRQAKAQRKLLHDSAAYETLLEPDRFSEANGGPLWREGPLISDWTRKEEDAPGLRVISVSGTSEHVSADETTTRTTPPCHSQAFSHTAPDLDERHCTGQLRHFLGAGEHLMCHCSSEVLEEKKDKPRTLSSAGPLDPDRLLPSAATEQERKAGSEDTVLALSSQACNDPGRTPRGQSPLAAWDTIEGTFPGSRDSSAERQQPKSLDSIYGRGSGNILVTEQERRKAHFESQSVICDAQNLASLSGLKQDHVQCPEASTDLEEGRASPKQSAAWPGALRKVEPEASAWQHVKWKDIRPGMTEACRTDSESPRPTLLPDQSTSLGPSGVTQVAPGQCPEEIPSPFVCSGSTEDSRPLASSSEEEKNKAIPCSQLCSSQPSTADACSPHISTLRKGSKAAPLRMRSPFRILLSRVWEVDEIRESSSGAPPVLLAHDLEHKGVNVAPAPADSSRLEPSTAAAALSPGHSSLSIPDVKTRSLTHPATTAAAGSSRSVGDPEEKTAEKKSHTDLEAVPCSASLSCEPLCTLKDGASQVKPLVAAQGPHTLPLSESELVVEARHGHPENPRRNLSERTQPSPETGIHSYLNPQAKFVAKLKHICRPQVDSSWEEEEQQRDQASGGNPLPSGEGGLIGCQIREAETEEGAMTKPPGSQTPFSDFENSASLSLGQREAPQPGFSRPGQLQAPHHRCSLPVMTVFSGPEHSTSSLRPQFSGLSPSTCLQELNLSEEPPSPTDKDTQGPNKLWSPHLMDSGKSMPRTSPKTKGCNHKASSNLDSGLAGPVAPPYPTSSTISCMPTPDLMANWMSGTSEEAHQGKPGKLCVQGRPENWPSQVDKGMLRFRSSDIKPCIPPWCPRGPMPIGWKQYVFGSAGDVSCSQRPRGPFPVNVVQRSSSSVDDGLQDKNLFRSHLSTCAKTQDQSSACSSIEDAPNSNEVWEVWNSSFALGDPHVLTGPEGVAPTSHPTNRPPFKSPADEAGCLRSELPLAVGSAAALEGEIVQLHPTEAGRPVKPTRMNTLEQGTQTLGCSLHQSCTDISAQSDAVTMSACELASWASMHNLSLHLSQILHSTSELLGSLSQPSVAKKEQTTKSASPDEAPQASRMDGATQTTVDKGVQTDLASPPLSLPAPEVKLPREVGVFLEVPDSSVMTMSEGRRDVSGVLQKTEAEETAWKTALRDLHEEITHCRSENPPVPMLHLKVQKTPLAQLLSSGSSTSDTSLPHSFPLEDSCMVASSSSLPHSPGLFLSTSELTQKPCAQKNLGPTSASLVDRASSPILALSAGIQELGPPLACLPLSAPSLKGYPLDISPDLAVDAPGSPKDHSFQITDESGGPQRSESLGRENKSPLGRNAEQSCPESGFPRSPGQSASLLQPTNTAQVQGRPSPSPPRDRSQRLEDDRLVPKRATSLELGPRSSREPSQQQAKPSSGLERSTCLVEPHAALELCSWRGVQPLSPHPVTEETDTALGPPRACRPVGLLCPSPQHHSLRDLPVHNKFNNWCGLKDDPSGEPCVNEELGAGYDPSSGDQGQRPPRHPDDHNQDPARSQREHIPLQVEVQNPSLSMELTEAKLQRGFGETDALLQVLQSGTGEALAPEEKAMSTWEELYARQKKAIETLRRERAERLQNFRRTRSLSPQKQLSLPSNKGVPAWELDLPSRRREYLQRLRKDVVDSSRSPESASRLAPRPSNIESMLKDYQQAREEAKVEIAQARDRLRERTEQEKLHIRQQIISQLLREEEKLQTLAHSSSLCTSSSGSLSSGVTSGYNSSPALSGHLQCTEGLGGSQVPGSRDACRGDWRGCSAVRNSQLHAEGSAWKSLAHNHRSSLGRGCCSPASLSSLGTCYSSSYKDLAKHIVDTSMADVMAACSDDLHNLFSRQAAAGWNYQGEEQQVQFYYKEFSSTRHGFLGAGVVSQPLAHVWAAVSDPSLWPLYHKPIQTARLHQRVTNSISLVYLVCDTTLCALKQLRDFCCVCVEAKEVPILLAGHLSIMAAQSVYDTSMPRPSRKMVRGEILPSAWVLQPAIMEGKEITRVIFLAQVELGAPGFPPHLLSSFIKQQPLVVAKLASFLGS